MLHKAGAVSELAHSIPRVTCMAGILLLDERKRVMLLRSGMDHQWCIPGGSLKAGESAEDAAKRELFEKTNLVIEHMQLFNVYSGPDQHMRRPDGTDLYFVNVVFLSMRYHGIMRADGIKCKEIQFFNMHHLPKPIHPTNDPIFRELTQSVLFTE